MERTFPKENRKWVYPLAGIGALLLAVALFSLIPLTQWTDEVEEPDLEVREVSFAPPPPPDPPPPPEKEPEPEKDPVSEPEIAEKAEPVEIEPLDVDLSPGAGDAVKMGPPDPALDSRRDTSRSVRDFFTFDDLPEAPRLVNRPNFRFPKELARRGVEKGEVIAEIKINPNGRAELREIISFSHRELVAPAKRIIRQARFSKPVIDGKARSVIGRFPIILQN